MSSTRHLLSEVAGVDDAVEESADVVLSPKLPSGRVCCCADLEYVQDTTSICSRETPQGCVEWVLSLYAFVVILAVLLGASHGLVFVSMRVFNYTLNAGHVLAILAGIVVFGYVEGYRGFYKSWSPITAHRCLIVGKLVDFKRNVVGSIVIVVLAPLFASGFFFASKRRIILSYGLVALIVCFILIVKQLPSPWHEIVDCGVAFGLSTGTLSFLVIYLKALWTKKLP